MYEVSWCIIGETPEAEPFLFSSGKEAVKFLLEEIYWITADLSGDTNRQASRALLALKHIENAPKSCMFTIGDIVYWINDLDAVRESIEMLGTEEL